MNYKEKYLKYKNKYLQFKYSLNGGAAAADDTKQNISLLNVVPQSIMSNMLSNLDPLDSSAFLETSKSSIQSIDYVILFNMKFGEIKIKRYVKKWLGSIQSEAAQHIHPSVRANANLYFNMIKLNSIHKDLFGFSIPNSTTFDITFITGLIINSINYDQFDKSEEEILKNRNLLVDLFHIIDLSDMEFHQAAATPAILDSEFSLFEEAVPRKAKHHKKIRHNYPINLVPPEECLSAACVPVHKPIGRTLFSTVVGAHISSISSTYDYIMRLIMDEIIHIKGIRLREYIYIPIYNSFRANDETKVTDMDEFETYIKDIGEGKYGNFNLHQVAGANMKPVYQILINADKKFIIPDIKQCGANWCFKHNISVKEDEYFAPDDGLGYFPECSVININTVKINVGMTPLIYKIDLFLKD